MKKLKLSIIFGSVIIVIIIFFILKFSNSNIKYEIITKNNSKYNDKNILSFDQKTVDAFLNPDYGGLNITVKEAVEIAKERVFDSEDEKLKPPYSVYFDEENNVYIILAEVKNNRNLYRVIISKLTGGVLLVTIFAY